MLQTCGSPLKDVSVKAEPNLHGKTFEEHIFMKQKELERLKIENEIELRTLKNLLEVRNIPISKVCFSLTSRELQHLRFIIRHTSDCPSDLTLSLNQLT
jgi:hypothetical protein